MTAPAPLPWLSDAVVQAVLHRLIDMTDQQPMSERARPPGFRLTPATVPPFFAHTTSDELAFAWSLIESLSELGWIRLQQGKPKPGYAAYELEPRLCWTPTPNRPFARRWRARQGLRVWPNSGERR